MAVAEIAFAEPPLSQGQGSIIWINSISSCTGNEPIHAGIMELSREIFQRKGRSLCECEQVLGKHTQGNCLGKCCRCNSSWAPTFGNLPLDGLQLTKLKQRGEMHR